MAQRGSQVRDCLPMRTDERRALGGLRGILEHSLYFLCVRGVMDQLREVSTVLGQRPENAPVQSLRTPLG